MRIILSRKGFDTSSGGCPNPIFPDGSLLALPIPDARSMVRYRDIGIEQCSPGPLVSQLTRGRIKPSHGAHLDPDVTPAFYPRRAGWRPLFGQHGSAQGHLRRQGVGTGDLFLFFGLFREVEKNRGRWVFRREARPHHRIWGWFQVGEQYPVSDLPGDILPWASYHPHCAWPAEKNNCLYLAAERLSLGTGPSSRPGAGCFGTVPRSFRLTAEAKRLPGRWKLPGWFYPAGDRRPLTYHGDPNRWRSAGESCYLSAAARGQEFVLHCDDYAEAVGWARQLIESGAE